MVVWTRNACSKVNFSLGESNSDAHTWAEFERSRIFRPRLLIRGSPGMGQQYLAAALLNHLDGLHVQSFDLPSLLSDATRVRAGGMDCASTANSLAVA